MKELSRKGILIEKAIQAYIQDFDQNNHRDDSSLRNESIKWTAAANFAQNWDIDADDMLSMWKRCTKEAFIDTRYNHPSQGITQLLKFPNEVEGVRNAFHSLFNEEPVEAEEKWDRITAFMDYINGRLKDHYPNSIIYQQTKEAVLTYLNLWDPDHNYRYKPAPANNWAEYIGYGDWESGKRFSLSKYYKMCDEIHEVVKNHEELLRVHRRHFENGEPDYDKELHILTFDVLYCFWGYKGAKEEALKEYQDAVRQQRIDQLEEQLKKISDEIQIKSAIVSYPDCIGLTVCNERHGIGIVKELADKRIAVDFETVGRKLYIFHDAFVKGKLQIENDSFIEQVKQMDQIEKSLITLKEQERKITEELRMLENKEKEES